jgi:hypothetical protein
VEVKEKKKKRKRKKKKRYKTCTTNATNSSHLSVAGSLCKCYRRNLQNYTIFVMKSYNEFNKTGDVLYV